MDFFLNVAVRVFFVWLPSFRPCVVEPIMFLTAVELLRFRGSIFFFMLHVGGNICLLCFVIVSFFLFFFIFLARDHTAELISL